jgi:Leucine-rich repeat (LRR) protein
MPRAHTINLLLWLAALAAAVALMAEPLLFPDQPHAVLWGCFLGGLGLAAVLVAIAIVLAVKDEATAKPNRRRPMIALVGMIIFGVGFIGCAGWFFWPTQSKEANPTAAVAKLTELGWTVKPSDTEILFEVNARPLPPMKESARYFSEIKRPFKLHFQQIPSLDGLHFISDIEECKNIEIGASGFTDLSELRGFSYLETLIISQTPFEKTQVLDPTPLSSLVNLRFLNLNMSRVRSSDFLASLKNLQSLYLGGTLISDVSSLAALTELQSLDIRDTRVTDMRPLMGLSKLADLSISGAQVPGLVSLSNLSSLNRLTLIDQRPTDLGPVGNLKNLVSLFVWALPDFDVSALRNLTRLESLQLSGIGFGRLSPIRNVESLAELTSLKQLTLGQIAFAELDVVKYFSNLEELNLSQLPINSISAIQGLPHLKKVSMVDIPVVDVSPLLQVPNLTEVYLIRVPARSDVLIQLQRDGVKVTQP